MGDTADVEDNDRVPNLVSVNNIALLSRLLVDVGADCTVAARVQGPATRLYVPAFQMPAVGERGDPERRRWIDLLSYSDPVTSIFANF